MSSYIQSKKAPIIAGVPPPVIIGHSCGYLGYNEQIYSGEATRMAYMDCNYLEIDLTLKKKSGKDKWWYFHRGKHNKEEGRKDGISFDMFLKDFGPDASQPIKKPAENETNLKPGIFLDIKKYLNRKRVKKLMNYLNKKYQKGAIPKGTPLMIYTGKGLTQGVRRHTTLYFVKWLYENEGKDIMKHEFCPRLTLVTRDTDLNELITWKGLLSPLMKSALSKDEIDWFNRNLNDKFFWAFNPNPFWLFKPNFKGKEIFNKRITVIPWFNVESSETETAWIKVMFRILEQYLLYRSGTDPNKSKPPPLSWGLITHKPNKFKETLRKWSFDDLQ